MAWRMSYCLSAAEINKEKHLIVESNNRNGENEITTAAACNHLIMAATSGKNVTNEAASAWQRVTKGVM